MDNGKALENQLKLMSFKYEETYYLGKIKRSYTLYGENKTDDIDLLVSYVRLSIHSRNIISIVEGEHLKFEDGRTGLQHEYFSGHPLYSKTFSKWTLSNGNILRELREHNKKEKFLLDNIDKDILEKLKNMPEYVKSVIGL